MSAARDLLAESLGAAIHGNADNRQYDYTDLAFRHSPQLKAALSLGLAFADAESALPEGAWLVLRVGEPMALASAERNTGVLVDRAEATPVLALQALAQRLREAGG